VGIGGAGLSAIARVLLERGERVSGSDLALSGFAQALMQAGAAVAVGHRAANVAGADLVIASSAIPEDNPELVAARRDGIPVLRRSSWGSWWRATERWRWPAPTARPPPLG